MSFRIFRMINFRIVKYEENQNCRHHRPRFGVQGHDRKNDPGRLERGAA